MENLFIYFLKANGLLVTFFLAYYFLLRKETFFNKNRWFLILGLVASVLLPLITFTKTVWIEPSPIVYEPISYENIPYVIVNQIEESPFDWNSFFMYVYLIVTTVFLVKMTIELFSFFRIIKFGNRIKSDQTILIDTNQNTNPFSFFKYIVYNKQMFSEEELQHIISHENIHVKEKHSIDVLLGKIFCAIFWINPIMWFYRKEMLQNLEYIADNKASSIAQNRINYQKTLLKVVTNQHPLTITNQFYQSLIKKRIVMLNTNQSNPRKSWKYALILPVLSAFMLFFQVETVAQVKEQIAAEAIQVIEVEINKNSTDAYISEQIRELKEDGIIVKISKLKRNKNNEIKQISIDFIDNEGNIVQYESKSDEPIETIYIYKEFGGNKRLGISTKSIFDNDGDGISDIKELQDRINSDENFKNIGVNWDEAVKISNERDYEFVTTTFDIYDAIETRFQMKNDIVDENEQALFYYNNKEISTKEAKKLDGNSVIEITQIFPDTKMITKYGEKGKNGVILINSEIEKPNSERNKLYIINGKEYLQSEITKGTTVEVDGKISELDKEEAIKKYGQKAKDGVLVFEGKSTFITDKNPTIYIDDKKGDNEKTLLFESGEKIIYYNETIKIPGQPAINVKDFKISINDTEINEKDFKSLLNMKFNRFVYWEKSKILKFYTNALPNIKTFDLSNGDQIVVTENNRIKIPEFPTTILNKASIYFNDKKISDSEFIKMNYNDTLLSESLK